MAPTNISRQTSTAVPLQGELTRAAPEPRSLGSNRFNGTLQWTLEGAGWSILRPALDFLLLWGAVTAALGGGAAMVHARPEQAPLLALPPLVILFFYLRGLYRTRLRALVLDGVVPIVSAVSIAAMSVAMIGIFANHAIPDHFVRAWLFSVLAVGSGRVVLSMAKSAARARRLDAQQG